MQIEALPMSLQDLAVSAPAPMPRQDSQPVPRPAPAAQSQRTVAPPARSSVGASVASGELAARSSVGASVASGEIGARPPVRPAPPPPPPRVPARPQPDAALASGMQPWLPDPSISGAAASWREAPTGRRDLTLPAILAVLALGLLLLLGFVALQL